MQSVVVQVPHLHEKPQAGRLHHNESKGDSSHKSKAWKVKTMESHSDLIEDDNCTILELLDRLLNKGVVVAGDIAISVADIDLIYLRAQLLLSSFETARQAGCLWASDNGKTRTAIQNS